jgi:imidazolonepropionase-like amidohydrolase
MALAELGSATRAELLAVEPGLQKLAPPLRPTFETFGAPAGGTPEESAERHRLHALDLAVVRALHAHGVPIVAGTDQAVPGHSIHREIELYVEAGLTPMAAIQSATLVPAKAMKLDAELGTIAPGKRADLIVVDGDPLADIRNLRRVTTVVTGGRAYETGPLWQLVDFTP